MRITSTIVRVALGAGLLAVGWSPASAQVVEGVASQATTPEVRRWTDSTGHFHTDAMLLGRDRAAVRLRKSTGTVITVAFERLSGADQQFVIAALPPAPESVDPLAAGISYLAKKPVVADAVSVVHSAKLLAQPSARVPENMVYVRLSRPFLQRLVERQVRQSKPVNDYILGSTITGTSETRGATELVLQPSAQHGELEIRLSGVIRYRTVASHGPVEIFADGAASFAAAKAVWIDRDGIATGRAASNVNNASTITGVDSSLPGLLGRIARRIGSRRAASNRPLADEIAGQHLQRHINDSVNQIADGEIAQAWANLRTQIAALPEDDPLCPSAWQVSTTADALKIVVLGRGGGERVPPPDDTDTQSDIVVRVHAAALSHALADENLRKFWRAVATPSSGADSQSSARAPTMNWSADERWLSISWSEQSSAVDGQPELPARQRTPAVGPTSATLVDRLPR